MVHAWCRPPPDLEPVWWAHREVAPPRQAGGHRYGSRGSTDASDVPRHTGRLLALLASRSHGCQPLSRILAIFGVFCAKIHSEKKRLDRLHLPGTTGSPWGARMARPPKAAFEPYPTPRGWSLHCPPASHRPGPSILAPALPSPNPTPNYFHLPQLLVSPHSRVPPNSPVPSAQLSGAF